MSLAKSVSAMLSPATLHKQKPWKNSDGKMFNYQKYYNFFKKTEHLIKAKESVHIHTHSVDYEA